MKDDGEVDRKSVYLVSAWVYAFPIAYLGWSGLSGHTEVITNPTVIAALLALVGTHMAVGLTEIAMSRGGYLAA